jgi:hypothetical protein
VVTSRFCAVVSFFLKSGNLNLLETSGPVQDCNGTVLSLPLPLPLLLPLPLPLLDADEWSTTRLSRFTPKNYPVTILQEAGCAPGPVWTSAENFTHSGIRPPDRPARSESLHRLFIILVFLVPWALCNISLIFQTLSPKIFQVCDILGFTRGDI